MSQFHDFSAEAALLGAWVPQTLESNAATVSTATYEPVSSISEEILNFSAGFDQGSSFDTSTPVSSLVPSQIEISAPGPNALEPASSDDNQADTVVLKTRKRLKRPTAKELRKKARNSGEAYKTVSKKQVPAKVFTNKPCSCFQTCHEKISEPDRENIFKTFWNMRDFISQNAYLCGLILQTPISTRRPTNNLRSPKQVTYTFCLQIGGENIVVCKSYFLHTFQISDGRLTRALKKSNEGAQIGSDMGGRHEPSNKTPDDALKLVRDHINCFPAYESHYTRHKNPHRKLNLYM